MTSPASKLVIIGLDGATWDVIRPALARGELPTLAEFVARGAAGPLRSSPVPVSPCAWTCMTTGRNPAKHGIYDFCRREPDGYRIGVVGSPWVRAERIWDYVGAAGGRSVVCNVPVTWPPKPAPGAVILSGLLTPSLDREFTSPPEVRGALLAAVPDYRISTGEVFDPSHPERFADDVRRVLAARERAVAWLQEHHASDFEMYVFMALDHVQHKLWRRPGVPIGQGDAAGPDVLAMYREADAALGRVLARYDPAATNVLVVSDHGFGPLEGVLRLNRWLMGQGYLCLRRSAALGVKKFLARTALLTRTWRLMQRLGLGGLGRLVPKGMQQAVATSGISLEDVDWSRTRAYAFGEFGQVFLNLKGREPQGIVAPGCEADELLDEITARLRTLRDPRTGAALVTEVHCKKELYAGPLLEQAPDLTFAIGDYRYDASVALGFEQKDVLGPPEFFDSGSHRSEGILLARGPDVAAGCAVDGAGIYDIAPTALHLMGLAVPRDMDGRVLSEMLRGDRPVAYRDAAVAGPQVPASPAQEADPDVVKRLKALGYMD